MCTTTSIILNSSPNMEDVTSGELLDHVNKLEAEIDSSSERMVTWYMLAIVAFSTFLMSWFGFVLAAVIGVGFIARFAPYAVRVDRSWMVIDFSARFLCSLGAVCLIWVVLPGNQFMGVFVVAVVGYFQSKRAAEIRRQAQRRLDRIASELGTIAFHKKPKNH